ncbi:MAG: PAS domain S-box protein [Actinomycetota bacterium]
MTTTHENASLRGFTGEEQRMQLRMLIEHALDAVVFMDESGRVVEWNPRAEELFGWTRDEALGQTVSELIVLPRFRESHERWMERFAAGDHIDGRLRLLGRRRDGSEMPLEVTIWSVDPSNGGQRMASAFIRDRSVEEQAAEMQARLAAIVDSSDDAIVGMDLDGYITSWNRGAERLYGYMSEEAIGRHTTFIIPPERSGDVNMLLQRLARGDSITQFDTVRVARDGREVDVSLSASPIFDSNGEPIGASSIARDVTERKRLEEESRRLNEELELRVQQRTAELAEVNRKLERQVASKTDFVASVSHELRTPLTSVIGFAELLMDSTAEFDKEQRRELLGSIANQGYELANIVEDLLVAARAEIGDLNVSKVPVNLRAQTAQVLESMRDEAAATITIPGEARYVIADPQRVRQILRNLLTNAIRYGGPHIEAEISGPVDGFASVTVSDDGEGIPPDARDTIFEPYDRGDNATAISESFGLGLSISRALARLMGGDLEYRRTERTEFVLSLPVDPER